MKVTSRGKFRWKLEDWNLNVDLACLTDKLVQEASQLATAQPGCIANIKKAFLAGDYVSIPRVLRRSHSP